MIRPAKPRTATGKDGSLAKCNFENLKPVDTYIKNFIWHHLNIFKSYVNFQN